MREKAKERAGIASSAGVETRLGLEFWDHLIASIGLGWYSQRDLKPISEQVVGCTEDIAHNTTCDTTPFAAQSKVGGYFLAYETGYQYRFRPWDTTSWTPGLLAGYLHTLGGLDRQVDCVGCRAFPLDVTARGAYLAPFFRITVGDIGMIGLVVRSQWFVTGDFSHMTFLGVEFGVP